LETHADEALAEALAGRWTSEKADVSIKPAGHGAFSFEIVDHTGNAIPPLCPRSGAGFAATIEGVGIAFLYNSMVEEGDDVIHSQSATEGNWGIFAIKLDSAKQSISAADLKDLGSETTYRAIADYIRKATIRRDYTFTKAH
jgi:hypothetical protein